MRYEVRHISLRSTLRFGLLVGALLGALPGICMGALATQVIDRTEQFLTNIQDVNVELPDVEVGPLVVPLPNFTIDLINALGIQDASNTVGGLDAAGPLVFLAIVALSILAFAVMVVLPMLVFGMIYNTIAPMGGGFQVDLAMPGHEHRQADRTP